MHDRSVRDVAMPLVSSGVLMAAYLLVRPYGDSSGDLAAAEAMASTWWVVSHVCGMLAIASLARAALRMSDLSDGIGAMITRWAGLGGLVLVLPYYGAETFALHVIARRTLATGGEGLELVAGIREQPVAMTMFALGLLFVAVSALGLALLWRATATDLGWAGWPLAMLVVMFLPQFYLPEVGRMAYGVAYLVAAVTFASAVAVAGRHPRPAAPRLPQGAGVGGS